MKSLFLKIFLSYWVAQALFLALAILITVAVRERGESAAWDAQQSTVLEQGDPDLRTERSGGSAPLPRGSSRLAAYPGLPAGRSGKGCLRTRSAALGGVAGKGSRAAAPRLLAARDAQSIPAAGAGCGQRAPLYPGGLPAAQRTFWAGRRSRPEHSDRNYFVRPGVLSAGAIPDRAGGPPARGYAAFGGRRSERPGGWPCRPAPRRNGATGARF